MILLTAAAALSRNGSGYVCDTHGLVSILYLLVIYDNGSHHTHTFSEYFPHVKRWLPLSEEAELDMHEEAQFPVGNPRMIQLSSEPCDGWPVKHGCSMEFNFYMLWGFSC